LLLLIAPSEPLSPFFLEGTPLKCEKILDPGDSGCGSEGYFPFEFPKLILFSSKHYRFVKERVDFLAFAIIYYQRDRYNLLSIHRKEV
jgi:hypothetical protein